MDSYTVFSLAFAGLMCVLVLIAPPWIYLFITRIRRRRPLLIQWSQPQSRTDLLDVIFVVLVYLISQAVAIVFVADLRAISSSGLFSPILITPLNSAVGLSVMGGGIIAFALVYLRRRDLRDTQIRLDKLGKQILIGFVATACVLPLSLIHI